MTMLKRLSAIMLVGALGCLVASHTLLAQTGSTRPASQAGAAAKGPRPDQFKFPPLDFTPPKAAEFRTVLSNGLVVYIAEDHEIPWFEATLLSPVISAGGGGGMGRGRGAEAIASPQAGGGAGGAGRAFLEPLDKLGVEGLTGSIARSGGTTTMTGDEINERMDFLAGSVSATALSLHVRHVDEGLKIWLDLLTNPAFPEDRLQREKQGMLPGIRNRNRNISTVASRTFQRLVYGDASPIVAQPTEATINGIDPGRPGGLAQEVLGREQRHPRRHRRLQEGRDAPEAGGHLRQVAERRQGGAGVAEARSRRRSPASTWCSRRGPRRTRASSRSATSG